VKLRPYQEALEAGIWQAWARPGVRVVLAVLPTGGGKTVIFCTVVRKFNGPAVVLAHRRELIAQMSLALAREGVRHRIIGPSALIKLCVTKHMKGVGRSWFDPNARVAVASVQSVSDKSIDPAWATQVGLWVGDEGHHYLKGNEFGRALSFFPNARGLLVTATPGRADGQGLGSHADGLADAMVLGPNGRDLIAAGYLSKYRLFTPPSDLHREDIPVTASGDFSPVKLREETARSSVTGDVVQTYHTNTPGKLGLTFADSIENATTIASKFRDSGVRAEVLTGKSPDTVRDSVLGQFEQRQVLQIVSVQLIDEGFDCPAVEVVSDAAATESFGRFTQRFGRGLRIMDGKEAMWYFDHVGNLLRHGNPTAPREWTLDRRAKRAASEDDAIPLRVCAVGNKHDGSPPVQGLATTPGEWAGWSRKIGDGIRAMTSVPDDGAPVWLYRGSGMACAERYERFHKVCPYCGHQPEPQSRSSPEFVEGDLTELTDEALAKLRGEVIDLDAPPPDLHFLGPAAQGGARKNHERRATAQQQLRDLIALWAGWQRALGRDDSYAYRLFFHTYGHDVLGAQALGGPDASALAMRLALDLATNGVTEA
jgi:DNA repair protein RadD